MGYIFSSLYIKKATLSRDMALVSSKLMGSFLKKHGLQDSKMFDPKGFKRINFKEKFVESEG